MASEVAGMPNGTYAPHQAYGGVDQNSYNYNGSQTSQPPAQQAAPTPSTPSNSQQPDIPKDEVGWYFVEQYYTTLSRSPDKLYLFYNKRSQFVSGQETDKVAVCVGQRAINDKIKELDFQDCKVRVTNVDSQASDQNIVIQVIGELSNRSQPHRKFTQTFVLATQTNGYFVLNDIFRYLVEEDEEPEADSQQPVEESQQVFGTESGFPEPSSTEVEGKTPTSSTDPVAVEKQAQEVDEEMQEKLVNNVHDAHGAVPAATDGEPAAEEPAAVEEKPATQPEPEQPSEADVPAPTEADIEPERPKDPEPTPVTSRAAPTQAPAQPAAAPKPAAPPAPKTWASLAASAHKVATPVAPAVTASAPGHAVKPVTPTAPAKTAPSSASSAPSAPTAPAAQRQEAQGSDSQDEWSTVGANHGRQPSRANNVSQPEEPVNRGYIKNVNENVDGGKLKAELEKFGELLYFDIARQKNCAFVDFKTPEAYHKALNHSFKIGDDELYVEKRHFRTGQPPFIPRGQYQGNRGGARGGAGPGAPRGNYQGGRGNGNGAPRGRGGFPAQRGRGGAPA